MSSRDIRRKFGQNYLKDQAVLFEMGAVISANSLDNFIEIGPGLGALTNQINKKGVNIIGIEIDSKNIETLKSKYKGPANFRFINKDILKYDFGGLTTSHRIVGNLPYNISTQIILNLLESANKVIDMHFLVQREVAEKISGAVGTKDWGKLSIKIALWI